MEARRGQRRSGRKMYEGRFQWIGVVGVVHGARWYSLEEPPPVCFQFVRKRITGCVNGLMRDCAKWQDAFELFEQFELGHVL